MEERTLYEKRGRRYYPVAQEVQFNMLPEGDWLLCVRPGHQTITRVVGDARPEVLAAARDMREAMADAMRKQNDAYRAVCPRDGQKLSEREQAAMRAFRAVMGDERMLVFEGVSLTSVVEAGIAALLAKTEGDGHGDRQ